MSIKSTIKTISNAARAAAARAAAARAEAERLAKIKALKEELDTLNEKLKLLNIKKEKYETFSSNLVSLKEKSKDCSLNVKETYEYANEGVSSKEITPKLLKISKYSETLLKNAIELQTCIEDVKKKIDLIDEEARLVKVEISSKESALISLGG